jgi:hypothetical protein
MSEYETSLSISGRETRQNGKRAHDQHLQHHHVQDEDVQNLSAASEGNQSGVDTQSSSSTITRGHRHHRRNRNAGHYGVSWIERKVRLPGTQGTGIVKKADRETCTVEMENVSKTMRVFKKEDLILVEVDHQTHHPLSFSSFASHGHPMAATTTMMTTTTGATRGADDSHASTASSSHSCTIPCQPMNQANGMNTVVRLMGITTARYAMFQDQVKKHVMRRREKIKHRPNLREWQAILDMRHKRVTNIADEASSVLDLFLVPSCALCGVEKDVRRKRPYDKEM